MFRNLFISVVLGFALFIVTDSNAQSCPPGYNSEVLSAVRLPLPNGNICRADIYYCWKDDINGNRIIFVDAICFYLKSCVEGADLSDDEFWQSMMENLIRFQESLPSSDPEHLSVGPCTDPTIAVYSYREPCWTFSSASEIVIDEDQVALIRCAGQTDLCIRQYTLCYDYTQSPPFLWISAPMVEAPMSTLCEDGYMYDPLENEFPCFTIECVPGE